MKPHSGLQLEGANPSLERREVISCVCVCVCVCVCAHMCAGCVRAYIAYDISLS